jgi:hypothetical protein
LAPRLAPNAKRSKVPVASESGAPGRIRTRDPLLRRQPLYPTELLALCDHCARPRSRVGHTEVAVREGSDPGQYTQRAPLPQLCRLQLVIFAAPPTLAVSVLPSASRAGVKVTAPVILTGIGTAEGAETRLSPPRHGERYGPPNFAVRGGEELPANRIRTLCPTVASRAEPGNCLAAKFYRGHGVRTGGLSFPAPPEVTAQPPFPAGPGAVSKYLELAVACPRRTAYLDTHYCRFPNRRPPISQLFELFRL